MKRNPRNQHLIIIGKLLEEINQQVINEMSLN